MDPLAAILLEDMQDICLREDSASSNAREYSSNNDYMDESECDNKGHWLQELNVGDKLDYLYLTTWRPFIIKDIIPAFFECNTTQFIIESIQCNNWHHHDVSFDVDFENESTMKNLAPFNTYTPFHFPNYLSQCNSDQSQNCYICNRNSCKVCLLLDHNDYMDDTIICYYCILDEFKRKIMRLLTTKLFNDMVDKMDTNLLNLIYLFINNGITIDCCNDQCKNEINLDLSIWFKWKISQRDRRRCINEYYSLCDINDDDIYSYQVHSDFEINTKYPIQKRKLFGDKRSERIFCNVCYPKLKECKLCHFGLDFENICKKHPICNVCDKAIFIKNYDSFEREIKCKICDKYYHGLKCGMNDYCQNCVKWPLILHNKSKQDLLDDDLRFNPWRTAINYQIHCHKDKSLIFDKMEQLYCTKCNDDECENYKKQQENICFMAICWCCCRLIIEDEMDNICKCDTCNLYYHFDCSSVGSKECINCIVKNR